MRLKIFSILVIGSVFFLSAWADPGDGEGPRSIHQKRLELTAGATLDQVVAIQEHLKRKWPEEYRNLDRFMLGNDFVDGVGARDPFILQSGLSDLRSLFDIQVANWRFNIRRYPFSIDGFVFADPLQIKIAELLHFAAQRTKQVRPDLVQAVTDNFFEEPSLRRLQQIKGKEPEDLSEFGYEPLLIKFLTSYLLTTKNRTTFAMGLAMVTGSNFASGMGHRMALRYTELSEDQKQLLRNEYFNLQEGTQKILVMSELRAQIPLGEKISQAIFFEIIQNEAYYQWFTRNDLMPLLNFETQTKLKEYYKQQTSRFLRYRYEAYKPLLTLTERQAVARRLIADPNTERFGKRLLNDLSRTSMIPCHSIH